MSKIYTYGRHEFELTQDEYDFIERNDLWDGLSHCCHEWQIDHDPSGWDLMMECFIPFMTHGDVK